MGWANASYLDSVLGLLPEGARTGKRTIGRLRASKELSEAATAALRRYSRSERPGQEDGKALNAALLSGSMEHDGWAEDMDEAFVWSFDRDVVLWRGFRLPPANGEPSKCFVSTSLVERQARQFRSRGGSGVSAILLPAGSAVAVPSLVWGVGDDERTLGVVRREVEVILPRGTAMSKEGSAEPFPERGGGASRIRVHVYRADVPEPVPEWSPSP